MDTFLKIDATFINTTAISETYLEGVYYIPFEPLNIGVHMFIRVAQGNYLSGFKDHLMKRTLRRILKELFYSCNKCMPDVDRSLFFLIMLNMFIMDDW